MTYDLRTVMPQSKPPRPRWVVPTMAGLAVVVLVLVGVVVGLVAGRSSTPAPVAATSASTFTVKGQLHLHDLSSILNGAGGLCSGAGGYSDITQGASVSVSDAAGKILAVGSLAGGFMDDSSCTFGFTVDGVPHGSGPYRVEVSHRGALPFRETELVGKTIQLTLGR